MVERTKSGVYIRNDTDDGMYIFSPFTGLFYYVPICDAQQVYRWLNNESVIVDDKYKFSIGLVWYSSFLESYAASATYQKSPASISALQSPLVINWLLTGRCTHKCKYCYAFDLREVPEIITSQEAADTIIERILSYNPIAVVLSGGEPILCKHLNYIIDKLYLRTGIILDTNGHLLDKERATFLKSRDVVVRISIDTFIPKIERKLRSMNSDKLDKDELEKTVNALNICLENNISIVVHTVVTKENINDLDSMGEKLYCLGIREWKLMELAKLNHSKLSYLYRKIDTLKKSFIPDVSRRRKSEWRQKMRIVFQSNTAQCPNTAILVAPDGEFLLQQATGKKAPIDPENVFHPSMNAIKMYIELWEHRNRYIEEWY